MKLNLTIYVNQNGSKITFEMTFHLLLHLIINKILCYFIFVNKNPKAQSKQELRTQFSFKKNLNILYYEI